MGPPSIKSLKSKKSDKPKQDTNDHDISVDILIRKLKSIGITLDLNVLRYTVNGYDKKCLRN